MHVRQVINKHVVDRVTIREAKLCIKRLTNGDTRDIIGDKILKERERVGSFDLEFTHVAHVEEASTGAYRLVLLQNTAVLNGHFPATELYKTGTHCVVLLVEWRTFQRCAVVCCHV